MRIFLNLDEMKTIRVALYGNKNDMEKGLKEHQKPEDKTVRDIVEEVIASVEKLLLYFNEEIKKQE